MMHQRWVRHDATRRDAIYFLTARSTEWVQESIEAMHVTLLRAAARGSTTVNSSPSNAALQHNQPTGTALAP